MRPQFINQFAFAHQDVPFRKDLDDFLLKQVGQFQIYHSANLPVAITPITPTSTVIIIGWIFNDQGDLLSDALISEVHGPLELHARLVRRYFGRFVAIHVDNSVNECHVVVDSAGTLSTLYQHNQSFIVSTEDLATHVQLPIAKNEQLEELESRCRSEIEYWYPVGLTSHDGLKILFPNHLLKIGSDSHPVRVWPSTNDLNKPILTTNEVGDAFEFLKAAAKCVKNFHHITLPLTGGRDSRALLAAILDLGLSENTTCYTTESAIDSLYARTLAHAFNLPWVSDDSELPSGCILPGFGGEIVKGYWYQNIAPHQTWTMSIKAALPFYSIVQYSVAAKDELDHWLSTTTPVFESGDLRVLDLAYLELRWAATMGQVNYYYDQHHGTALNLFAHPRIIDTGFRLPADVRMRMSFWKIACNRVAKSLSWLPAGIPHYGRKELLVAVARLTYAWAVSPAARKIVYSKANITAMKLTVVRKQNRVHPVL